jgi:hypothetical protein
MSEDLQIHFGPDLGGVAPSWELVFPADNEAGVDQSCLHPR